jgi:three-Cys-motif partner protein
LAGHAFFSTIDDEIGIWSELIKHNILREYLPARRRILHKNRHWFPGGDYYVDGFAGAGEARIRGHELRVKGSPRIALDVEHPFDHYWFIEMNRSRRAQLENLSTEYSEQRIRVLDGDCNEAITEKVTPVVRREHKSRGFVFLDPFGMNLHWKTIEAVAKTHALETIINLPTMAMCRGGLPNAVDGLTQAHVERMGRLWGSSEWKECFYESRPGLWGPHTVKAGPSGASKIGANYKERLQTVFPFVSDPLVVHNTKGAPIYCLLFAGPNETGWKIAGQVLRKASRSPWMPPAQVEQATALPLLEAV